MSVPRDDRRWWLDRSENVTRVYHTLVAVCVLLLAADAVYEKHVHYSFESWFGFYGIFGFLAYTALVMTAKQFRKVVRREEDYYD